MQKVIPYCLNNQKGVTHLLLLIAALGILVFIFLSSTAEFKNKLFSTIFPKPSSQAATEDLEIENLTKELVTKKEDLKKPRVLNIKSKQDMVNDLAKVASKRHNLLLKKAKENPESFLRLATLVGTRNEFPDEARILVEKHQEIQGDLVVVHLDDKKNNKSKFEYFIQNPKIIRQSDDFNSKTEKRVELTFVKKQPELSSGIGVVASGIAIDSNLVLESGDKTSRDFKARTDEKVLAAPASPFGDQKTAVILINLSSSTYRNPVTKDQLRELLFGATNSVDSYYKENSFGQTSFSGDVLGPYEVADTGTCSYWNNGDQAVAAATAAGVNISLYQRLIYVFTSSGGCPYAGLGTVGGSVSQSWILCCQTDRTLYYHEVGHNVGVHHASSLNCPTSSIDSTCNSVEYGDPSDTMGSWNPFHFNGPHKTGVGWIPTSRVQNVTSSGTYTISDLESLTPDPQILKILHPNKVDSYYISFRQPLGYDLTLDSGITKGVNVHLWSGSNYYQTQLVDTTPGSIGWMRDSSLSDGTGFNDLATGLSIKQVSHTQRGGNIPGKAVVEVKIPVYPVGSISATPNPCITENFMNPSCTSTITWQTSNATNVKVVSSDSSGEDQNQVISTAPSGSYVATVHKANSLTFQLYAGDVLLQKTSVDASFQIPKPVVTINTECIAKGYTGSDIVFSWPNSGFPPGYYVDISTSPDFSQNLFYKYVTSNSTTGPAGFYNLALDPGVVYYTRFYVWGLGGPTTKLILRSCENTPKKVFLTKSTFNGNLGGLVGADAKCQNAASVANLTGTYQAWISSAKESASSRLPKSTGQYKLVDGTLVANNWTDLTDGTLLAPINKDETGVRVYENSYAWTNTTTSGAVKNAYSCKDWTTSTYTGVTDLGNFGLFQYSNATWTDYAYGMCSSSYRLYCLQTSDVTPPKPPPTPAPATKRVFVTKATFSGNLGGLTGADAKCQASANAVNLGGSWKAWLSSTKTSASSRLAHNQVQHKLLNGLVFADSWDALVGMQIKSPLVIDETNQDITKVSTNLGVWTNTLYYGASGNTNGNQALACNDWSSNLSSVTGYIGLSNYINTNWTASTGNFSCQLPMRLYCFEQ